MDGVLTWALPCCMRGLLYGLEWKNAAFESGANCRGLEVCCCGAVPSSGVMGRGHKEIQETLMRCTSIICRLLTG